MLCLLFILGMGMAKAQTLVLHHADGTTTDVQLLTQPQVKFQDDRVLVTSTGLDMEFPKQQVLRFTYKGKTSAIGSAKANAAVRQENGQLVFHGIKAADQIAVYTMSGIRIPARIRRSGNEATLPLTSIPSGTYMLSINGKTSKFTKR